MGVSVDGMDHNYKHGTEDISEEDMLMGKTLIVDA